MEDRENRKILELYYENENENQYILYDDIVIASTVEILVCDHTYKKIVLPDELRVLDLHYPEAVSLDFNIPLHIQYIKLENISIIKKSLMELFPEHVYYYYKDCLLNDIPIYRLVNEKYQQYFNTDCLKNNVISHRQNKDIIDTIRKYEDTLLKARQRSDIIREELLMIALHPDRVAKWFYAGIHPKDM